MAVAKIEEFRLDVQELKKLEAIAERQKVKEAINIDIREIESKISTLEEEVRKAGQTTTKSDVKRASSSEFKSYDVKLTNYAWDGGDKYVKIYVTRNDVQNLPKENVQCKFESRSMVLYINGLDNRNYYLPILDLLADIDPSKSYFKVKKDMVIVYLAKEDPNKTWKYVTSAEAKVHVEKKPKINPESGPMDGLMDILKNMYQDGDDDLKRTIEKAWTTSRSGKRELDDEDPFKL